MSPVPTEFPYPSYYFSYEFCLDESERWNPPILGRDSAIVNIVGIFFRYMAFNLRYYLSSRSSPFESFYLRFFFEKFFYFQDYTLPYLWLYFPWIAFFFNYPIGSFQIQFFYYFPYFFFFCFLISIFFFFFSIFYSINRSKFDYFSYFIVLSFFFFCFPLFIFFSIPVFISGIFIFFIFSIFIAPLCISFSEYIIFKFPRYFSYSNTISGFFLPVSENSIKPLPRYGVDVKKKCLFSSNFNRSSIFFYNFKISKPFSRKRFTNFPFFNSNMKRLKKFIIKRYVNKESFNFSSLRFKKGLNDIRQFSPFEGPSVYDPIISQYDLDKPELQDFYYFLDDLVEDDFELDYGPDFEIANDYSMALESYDNWEFFSKRHFFTGSYKFTRSSYFLNYSPDLDFDLRPRLSSWINNEIGRVWILKHWLRFLNPKFSNKTLTNYLLNEKNIDGFIETNLYNLPSSFRFFKFFSFYFFFVIDLFFSYCVSPWVIRVFSNSINNFSFIGNLSILLRISSCLFILPSHYSNILRILFSLETYFVNNFKDISFNDKYFYFYVINRLYFRFLKIYTFSSQTKFIKFCLIYQLSRIKGKKKVLFC